MRNLVFPTARCSNFMQNRKSSFARDWRFAALSHISFEEAGAISLPV
jgi:hypothetical protein